MRWLIIIFLVIVVVAGWYTFKNNNNDYTFSPNKESLILPPNMRALNAVCYLGWPLMIKKLDENSNTNLVIFSGPIKDSDHKLASVFNYLAYHVNSPSEGPYDFRRLFDSLDDYKGPIVTEELVKYQLLMIKGLPDKLPKVVELVGQWGLLINRSNPTRERLVWRRKLCVGKKLIYGFWIEVIDDNVIKTGAYSSQKKIDRMF